MKLHVALIRCGMTESGEQGRFLGRRDEPLSRKGIEELERFREEKEYPKATLVFAGALSRCVETASILYPATPAVVARGLAPFDYGVFTGKTATELASDKQFRAWLQSDSIEACPGGDNPYAFQARSMRDFRTITDEMDAKGIQSTAVITHGTVITALMQRFIVPRSAYRNWETAYGSGYLIEYDSMRITAKRIASI